MDGTSSLGTRAGSSAGTRPLSTRELTCGLSAALARRELALFPRGTNSPSPASDRSDGTPRSSRPCIGYADEHLEKALLALGLSADIFWNEARSRTKTACVIRRRVWAWMRDTPIADGVNLTLHDIGEATGGYDHSTVRSGLIRERKDATNNDAADKRTV